MSTISPPGQITSTRRFTLGVPGQFTIARDGMVVLFLRSRAGDDPVACLWALDLDSGTEQLLAGPAALLADPPGPLAGEPTGRGIGIGAYAADETGAVVAFALNGGLWTWPTARPAACPPRAR
jgi:dipeptidyl-peptidase 4